MPADLIYAIRRHTPHDAEEATHQADFLELLTSTQQCFLRSDFPGELPGHITGSGLLVSPDGTQILMTHHKFLNRWLQFGKSQRDGSKAGPLSRAKHWYEQAMGQANDDAKPALAKSLAEVEALLEAEG